MADFEMFKHVKVVMETHDFFNKDINNRRLVTIEDVEIGWWVLGVLRIEKPDRHSAVL